MRGRQSEACPRVLPHDPVVAWAPSGRSRPSSWARRTSDCPRVNTGWRAFAHPTDLRIRGTWPGHALTDVKGWCRGRDSNPDPRITNAVLYRLSYRGRSGRSDIGCAPPWQGRLDRFAPVSLMPSCPGRAQHLAKRMMRYRPGIVSAHRVCEVPDQRRTASLPLALHRLAGTRDTANDATLFEVAPYDLKRARKRLQPSGGATDPGSTAGSSGGGSDSGPGSSGTCASAITGGGRGSSESPRGDDFARSLSSSTSALSDADVKASGRADPGKPPSDLLAAGAGAKASGLVGAGAASGSTPAAARRAAVPAARAGRPARRAARRRWWRRCGRRRRAGRFHSKASSRPVTGETGSQ